MLFATVFFACGRNPQHQFGDGDLAIQVRKAKAGNPGRDDAFQVRLFVLKTTEKGERQKLNEKMEYGNDSSFYRIRSGQKQYASGITPVSTGIRNCYEYLVFFSAGKSEEQGGFVYTDRYINGRTYQLSLR